MDEVKTRKGKDFLIKDFPPTCPLRKRAGHQMAEEGTGSLRALMLKALEFYLDVKQPIKKI